MLLAQIEGTNVNSNNSKRHATKDRPSKNQPFDIT